MKVLFHQRLVCCDLRHVCRRVADVHDAMLEESGDVVDDRCDGCQRHLEANSAERTQKLGLERAANGDETVQGNEHSDPDCPHLGDVDQGPDVHLHVGHQRGVVQLHHGKDGGDDETGAAHEQEDVVGHGHGL